MKLEIFPELDAWIKTQFAQPEIARWIWRQPLSVFMNEEHVPFDCTPGQFRTLQRKAYCEILRRTSIIPPRKHRGAGKAQVMLACHMAESCLISEAAANRIICSCYEFQELEAPCKNPPIMDSTSFRVTKLRMTPAE